MRVISVNNQKGGTGKTTLACHLALAARETHERVLLVDLDTQGSASLTLLSDPSIRYEPQGAASLFNGGRPQTRPAPQGLDLLHGHRELDTVDELSLDEAAGVGRRVRSLPYDLVVVDTPPAPLEARHMAPMFWADAVVIPLQADELSYSAIHDTLRTIGFIQLINPRLVPHLVINKFRVQDQLQRQFARMMREEAEFVEPNLGLHAAVPAALRKGVPVWAFGSATRNVRSRWHQVCGGLVS